MVEPTPDPPSPPTASVPAHARAAIAAGAKVVAPHETYHVPSNPITGLAWKKTERREGGASSGRWMEQVGGDQVALMKPGDPQAGRLDPAKEYVASIIGGWLLVPTKRVELYEYQNAPAALCFGVGETALTYSSVMDPVGQTVRAAALSALKGIVGTIVLDTLVGDTDRGEKHILYSEDRGEWVSIDYAHCLGHAQVIGDPSAQYGYGYFGEYDNALKANPDVVRRTVERAETIPGEQLKALIESIPEKFATPEQCIAMHSYLELRIKNIRQLVAAWCGPRGLDLGQKS